MRVLVVENYHCTPLGLIGPALAEAGATVDLRLPHEGAALPEDASGHDALIVLGGAQSALDDVEYPYLPHLAKLTRLFGEADKSVLGVCLGSQLIARAHGAENILGRPIEFGWHEVRPTVAGAGDPILSALDAGAPLFHWHSDTYTLPAGATHLATSAMTAHQAFRIGRAVYGLQFHFEADTSLVEEWNRTFPEVIAEYDAGWPARHARDAAILGPRADAVGAAIARRWIATIG